MQLSEVEQFYHERSGALQQLQARCAKLRYEQSYLQEELTAAVTAHSLLQQMADKERDVLQRKIESLVTYGVQAVFGPEYEFRLKQAVARGLITYDFELVTNGYVTPLADAHGGGILSVVGYLLRLIVVLLSGKRRVLVLDEAFGMVSREYLPAVAELMRQVTDKLDFQHILVTHSPELTEEADAVYRIALDDSGHSQVTREIEGL